MFTSQAVRNFDIVYQSSGFIHVDEDELIQLVELETCFVGVWVDSNEGGYLTAVFHLTEKSNYTKGDFEGCPRYHGESLQQAMQVFVEVLTKLI